MKHLLSETNTERYPGEIVIFEISLAPIDVDGRKRITHITSWDDNFVRTVLKKYTPEQLESFKEDLLYLLADSLKRELEKATA